jgi:hypothetical protein
MREKDQRIPVVPPPNGEWFWLPRFQGRCDCCGTDALLANSGRCERCEAEARALAERRR